ncbi:MAG: tripartite tricarboxylate transporter substrate binding protein [Betaproteobacteria bacterium]|nr:tripartite tricarboxylate transporter substrate binding protein [Betaproteobacteria bacterium]
MRVRLKSHGLLMLISLLSAVALWPQPARAQDRSPSRPVEVIVPWGPGGGADVLGRLVAKWLETDFKSTFVVINLPGATGSIGIGKMIQGGADARAIAVLTGDTLGLTAQPDSPFKLSDIVALAIMIRQPSGLFSKTDGPYKSWSDVQAAAKANPAGVTVAMTGPNSPDEATVNYLVSKGLRMTNVPYARPGERYAAVLGKHVDLLYEQAGDIKGQLDSKALRPLLFFASQRLPAPFADVPVSVELGYDILLPQTRTIVARAGTDPRQLAAFAASLDRFAGTPEFANYLRDQYALPDSYIAQRDAQKFLEGEVDALKKVLGSK